MCYSCMKEEHTQFMAEISNVPLSNRVVTLYHEGFTAAQISEIIDCPLDAIEKRIEMYA